MFADDQVTIADTEDNNRKLCIKKSNDRICFNSICKKTKSKAFKGRDPLRTKIVLDNKIIEEINSFNYLGNMIFYEKELFIDNKLHNYLKITVILNNVFRPQNPLRKQE